MDQIRLVALVARQGSFAAAARVLNVDPSSVSRTVAQTEAALGLRLFQRTTRALSVTEEGEVYLRRVLPLLEELEAAREEATRARSAPSGTLRMTASVAFSHVCVVPHLKAFHTLYPDISVELLPSDAVFDLAAQGIDLAIRLGTAPSGDGVGTRLLTSRYVVCAAPEYLASCPPLRAPADLVDHDCLRFALPEFRTRWRFRKTGEPTIEVPVSGRTIIASALSLRQAALDGLGPVLLADWLVGRDLAEGRLVRLFPAYEATATTFDTGAWALYPSRAFLPRKVRVMIDFLRDALRA